MILSNNLPVTLTGSLGLKMRPFSTARNFSMHTISSGLEVTKVLQSRQKAIKNIQKVDIYMVVRPLKCCLSATYLNNSVLMPVSLKSWKMYRTRPQKWYQYYLQDPSTKAQLPAAKHKCSHTAFYSWCASRHTRAYLWSTRCQISTAQVRNTDFCKASKSNNLF